MTIEAPFVSLRTEIKPEWIDFNGHFNAGYYMVVFDDAIGPWMRFIGLDDEHRAANGVTTFTVEGHITYDREVAEGEPIEVRTQLLGYSSKAVHAFQQMHHAAEGWLAATNEVMSLHISMETRRSAPMAPQIMDRLAVIEAAHGELPVPPQVGRTMGIRR
ncbi:MAG: thioesterase family protein [Actinomycetota bacterium]